MTAETRDDLPTGHVQVVRGEVDDDELAALVAGIAAASAAIATHAHRLAAEGTENETTSRWCDRSRALGHRHDVGPDAWRWSLRR